METCNRSPYLWVITRVDRFRGVTAARTVRYAPPEGGGKL
jgi:hypothetical protein